MSKPRNLLMAFRKGKWAIASRCIAIVAMHGLCANAYAANVLPTGGQYVAGTGSIATAPKGVVVNQSSSRGIVNWQSFSIGSGNTVQFNNGSGATLNRVTGGNLSQIDGLLKATGSVYLINPQGIVVGPGGKIVTNGSFVGSTRDINNNDFMSGNVLHATGTSAGNVVNQGSITSQYGDTILVGSSVTNSGSISAPNGTAAMAAGNDVLLRPMGSDPRIAVSAGTGNVTNTGTVAAAQAELAAAGGNVYALAGNSGGLVSATGTKTVNGHVWLSSGGTTEVSGAVKAVNANGSGGTIVATGPNTQVDSTARISASGTTGGTVLIGGDRGGSRDTALKLVSAPVANAKTASVAAGATISADGSAGNGGQVVVWSDEDTTFAGSIFARGGATGGNGGFVETSGLQLTVADSAYVNALAPLGETGDWLLDPHNITVATGGSGTLAQGAFSGGNSGTDITIAPSTINAAAANVTLQADNDITISNAISMTNSVLLTMNAGRSILVNANITSKGGFIATINDAGANSADRDPGKAAFTMAPGTVISAAAASAVAAGAISITTGTLAADNTGATSLAANIGNITLAALSTSGFAGGATSAGGNITVTNSTGNILSAASGTTTIAANGATPSSGTNVAGGAGGTIQITATNGAIGSATAALGAISSNGGAGRATNAAGGNGGAVTLTAGTNIWSGAVAATGGLKAGTGTAGTTGAISLLATNGSITITADALSAGTETFTANTTSGIVTIQSLTPSTTMGINNSGSTLNLVTANLARITAKTLQFGTAANTGGIIIGAVALPTTIGNIIATSGSLDTTGFGAVAINGNVTGAAGSLTLNATAADVYLESGTMSIGTLTANAATSVISSGSYAYNNTAGIVTLNSSGVDVNNTSVGLGSAMTANTLTMSGPGEIYQQTGAFKLTNLLVTGGTLIDLSGGNNTNQIANFAANTTGRIKLLDNVNLNIASIGGVNGVTANQFNLSFASTGKSVTQSASANITANEFSVVSGGTGKFVVTATLTNAGNKIGNFAASVNAGTISLSGTNGLNISTLFDDQGNQLANGVTAATLTLNNTGTVTQSSKIAASTGLELLGAGGNYQLMNASNTFGALSANTGSISVARSSAAALTVGTAGGTTGITTTGPTTLSGGAAVTVSSVINAGGALTIGAVTNVAVNANVSGSTVALKPDTGGTGTGSVTFGAGIKATGNTVSIYANSVIDYTANAVGTLYSYLYISTLAALQNIQNNLSGSYALNKDLDASSTATMNGGAGFSPIGTLANPFTGNFDGMGHTISGLTISRPTTDYVGLFGVSTGSIINIGLSSGSIVGRSFVGGIAGMSSGALSGVYSSASIMGLSDVGGLVGDMTGGSLLQSYDTGNVAAFGDYAGGLVGDVDSGTISQTYASGTVSGVGADVGGLIGSNGGSVSSSYFDKTIDASLSGIGGGTTTGATGLTSAQFATASNFSGWTFGTAAGGAGWVIVDADSTLNNAGGAVGGTRPMFLSEASTNGKINNAHQLQLIALNLAGSYTLGANIDMSETASASGVWLSAGFVPLGFAATDGTGTIPTTGTFAVTASNPFSGSFDGKTFTISNLTINRPNTDYVGLFGYVYNPTSGVILRNVNLIGGSITGRDHVGSILGGNRGYLDDGVTAVITYLDDTTTAASSSSASVTGRDFVGGLYGSAESTYSYFNTGTGTVTGRDYVGGVVGWLSTDIGFNTDMRSTATVIGRNNVGGLAGFYSASLYGLDYATGNVTATGDNVGGLMGQGLGTQGSSTTDIMYATGAVNGVNNVGGMIGLSGFELSHSFATGAVNGVMNVGGLVGNNDINSGIAFVDQSFATGTVHGVTNVGGLVGLNTDVIGSLTGTGGTYATGAVYGTTNVGGLVGSNIGDSNITFGKIVSSYSTGYVSGTTNVGGLVGNSTVSGTNAYIKNSYFDTETSGLNAALGTGTTGTSGIATASMPKTTAQLEAALLTGFGTAAWGIVANTSLPYFKWLYGTAPQVVTGTAYSDRGTTALVGAAANLYVSGLTGTAANIAASAVGSTGANGFYYFLVPAGTFTTAKQVLVTTSGANGGATFQDKTTASITGLSIYGTYLKEQANSATASLSTLSADLALAIGGNAAATSRLATIANLEIDITAANFALDQAINTNMLLLSSTGSVTETGTITASGVLLSGTGGNFALTGAGNAIGTIAASTATANVSDAVDLTVGTVIGVTGVTTTGATTLASSSNLTIASTAKVTAGANNNVALSAGGNFINNRGSDAVNVSGTGRWVIYSSAPGSDVFGNLNSNNTAVWNGTIGTLAPGSVASGNRYVFAYQPILTITTTNGSKTYGDVGDVSANYTISGLQAGVANAFLADTATGVFSGLPSLSSNGADAFATVDGGPYAITAALGTLTALNGYGFAFQNTGLLTVTARSITVTADDLSRLYGDANPAFTYQITGGSIVNGDTLSGSLTSSADTHSNVGQYDITQGTLTGGDNYAITFTPGTLTVNARSLDITADNLSRLYGDANPTLTYQVSGDGLVNGDTLSGLLTSAADSHSNVGQYDITQGTLTAGGNYAIAFAPGTLTVNARSLDISADDLSRLYGDANPTFTYQVTGDGLVNGDTLSGLLATSADTHSNVGQYDITQGALTAGGNYAITFTPGTLTVNQRTLDISADDLSRLYGDANPTLTYQVTGGDGLVNGDTLSGLLATSADAHSNVGQYDITQGALTAGGNYAIAFTPGALTITARTLDISADDLSRLYGDANPALTYQITGGDGLVNGDTLSGLLATSADGHSNVGQYGITQGALTAGGNYTIDFTAGTLTVTARSLDISGDDKNRLYGDANPAFTYQVTGGDGLVNGDTLGGLLATVADGHTGVGQYDISQGTLTAGGNYVIHYTPGVLTIAARTLDISADDLSRLYGDANPALSYQITGGDGLVNGDGLSGLLATVADTHSNVGHYDITQGTLTAGGNYIIDFTPGSLNVTARSLDISGDEKSRLYGDANPAFTYQVTGGDGLVNGDTLSGLLATAADTHTGVGSYDITQGTLTAGGNYIIHYTLGTLDVTARTLDISADDLSRLYGDANPTFTYQITGGDGLVNGDGLSGLLATAADTHSNVGHFDITQGALTAGGNYIIAFTPGTLNVTARSLYISADDLSRLYGDANPAFTYQITGGDGLVNGDGLSGLLTTAAGTHSNVGQYDITQGTLTAGGNYAITFTPGTLTVNARTLDISADDLSRLYGDANPAFTYQITGGDGLVNGDGLSGLLATTANAHSNVGGYGITQGGLTAGGNYTINFTNGSLSVTARALTVTADDLSRIYGNSNPALTYAIGGDGLVNGDTLTGGLTTVAGATSNVGNYAIGQGSLASSSNYALTYVGGTLAVTARPLTITADDLSRLYGNSNPALTYAIGGSGLVNGDTFTGVLATSANGTSNVGNYAIGQGTLAASSNYAVTYVGGTLSVTPRALTVSADDLSRIYGDANPALTYAIGGDGLVNGDALTGGLATAAGGTSNVGNYAITQGSLAASSNYTIAYTGGVLTITPRALTVTGSDLSRIYGDANPALAYAITNGNLVNGDTLTGGLATVAGLTSNVGNYAVTQGSLAASSNYALTYVGGTLAVTQRAITVTADDLSRIYGSANPALTYAIGGGGLVNGDTLSGSLTSSADTHSNVGQYGITQGSLAASSNYILTFAPGTLAITPAALIISADDISSLSLAAAHPTASYSGLVAGDTSSVLSGLQFGLFPITGNPFGYDVIPFGASAQNYTLSYLAGLLTLTAQPPGGFTTPVTPGGPLGTLPSLVLTTAAGTFSFSNVATASVGDEPNVTLFEVGLPGSIGTFSQLVITDYSNATNDNDRLVAAE